MRFPEHATVTITQTGSAGEQSYAIPADAANLTFQVRGLTSSLQYYFKSNANGGGPAGDGKYFTLPQGASKTFINFRMDMAGQTIYFQVPSGSTTPATVEIETTIS